MKKRRIKSKYLPHESAVTNRKHNEYYVAQFPCICQQWWLEYWFRLFHDQTKKTTYSLYIGQTIS